MQFARYGAPEAPGRYGTRLSVAEFCRARPRLQATPSEVLEAVTKHAWNERHGGVLRFIITGDVDPGDGTPIVEVPERPSNRLAREIAQGGPGEKGGKGGKGGYEGKGGKEKGKGKGKEKGTLIEGRRRIFVHGRVQGVHYRDATVEAARSRYLTGWVRNLRDGRVEIVAEGSSLMLREFVAWCSVGSRAARVARVDAQWEEATGQFLTFSRVGSA